VAHVIIREEPARASLIYDPKVRGIFFQVVLMALLAFGLWWIVGNTIENLHRSHIATGFGFLRGRAGFDISNRLIEYSSDSSYGMALVVGILNTAVVAVAGIITATIIGFLVGIGRLSNNWLIRKLATVYIEIFRNIPPLLVLLFWYQGVLALLPNVRDSYSLPFGSISTTVASIFRASSGATAPGWCWSASSSASCSPGMWRDAPGRARRRPGSSSRYSGPPSR
jgi:general L-amino acid transport system permease protein